MTVCANGNYFTECFISVLFHSQSKTEKDDNDQEKSLRICHQTCTKEDLSGKYQNLQFMPNIPVYVIGNAIQLYVKSWVTFSKNCMITCEWPNNHGPTVFKINN